jgi:hypothetical protein
MHVFEKVWNVGTATPQLAQVLRNVTRTLIETGFTFAEIPLLLWDETVREKLTANVKNTQTQLFWQQYNRRSVRDRDELTSSTINKVDAYLNEPMIANIVLQERSTIDFRTIMDESKIVLIRMSPQLEEMSRLVGSILIGRLLMAAFSRSELPEEQRRPFFLYVDEFERFCTDDFSVLIAESRKFRVAIGALANQTLEQLDSANRAAALQAGGLVAFRVSGTDAAALAKNYDHTPPLEQTGVEPVRAPVSDVVGHLVRRGHTNPVVGQFVTDYLMPVEALIRKVGVYQHEFAFGCTIIHASHLIEGQRLANDCLHECMRTGRGDGFIPPLALLILGGAADSRSTYVFFHHIKRKVLNGYVVEGFYERANAFGRAGFFANEQKALERLKQDAKTSVWDRLTPSSMVARASAFLRMLRSLREVMEILSKEPILVDTGQYAPVLRPRLYADVENQIANEIAQLANFTARVKLLSGEHTMQTHPAPQGLSGEALTARISAIKDRMLALGYCRYAREVEKEIADRHARLRQTTEEPPPTRARVRRAG